MRAGGCLFLWALLLTVSAPGSDTAASVPSKDEAEAVERYKYEYHGFRYLLDQAGLEPVSSADDVGNDPTSTVIVLFGPNSIENNLNAEILSAVYRGASLLIASDRRGPGRKTEEQLGVSIIDTVVQADPEDCFHDHVHYPYVHPLHKWELDKDSPRSIFADIQPAGENAVATNDAAVMRLPRRPFPRRFAELHLYELANYPFTAHFGRLGPRLDPSRDLFAVGGFYGDGRLLLLADHSVFVNLMLLRTDNANSDFARNTIEWLQGPGKKKRCLLVQDGAIQTEFRLPAVPLGDDWLSMLIKSALVAEKHGDQMISELEQRHYLDGMLQSYFTPRQIFRAVLIVASLLLLSFGFYRFLRSRAGADPARTLVTPDLAYLIPRGSALQQRFESQFENENFYESARKLIRDFLRGMDAEPDGQGRPPSLQIQDGYRNADKLRERIDRLWNIAFGPIPEPIGSRDWRDLTSDLKEVLEDADNGWWKFVPPP